MKYERLAEQVRRNSSVPAEQQVVGSYVVCRQKWQDGEMQESAPGARGVENALGLL